MPPRENSNVSDVGVTSTIIVTAMRNLTLAAVGLLSRLSGRVVVICPCRQRVMIMSPSPSIEPMISSNACRFLLRYPFLASHPHMYLFSSQHILTSHTLWYRLISSFQHPPTLSYLVPSYDSRPCIFSNILPPKYHPITNLVIYIVILSQSLFLFLALLCYFTGTFIAITIFAVKRSTRLVKASQPLMMMFIVAGCMLGSTRILMSYFDLTSTICHANIWYIRIHELFSFELIFFLP